MSKICGLVSTRPDFMLAKHIQRMYDASWHEQPARKELWSDKHVALGRISNGAVNPQPQPLFTRDHQQGIVYCGKIFNYGRLERQLKDRGIEFQLNGNDAEFLLQLLSTTGFRHLAQLNGIFSAAYWDSQEQRLSLITDRYGFRLVYYHHATREHALVFSSRLRGVVESGLLDARVHWPAWSSFLHFGHNLGDTTFFQGVFVVPPGSVLTYEDNQVRIQRYWDINDLQVDDNLTHREAVEGMVELFAQAIQRRNITVQGRKAVFLSGGLDSRRIAAELKKQGCEFTTYTTRGFSPLNEDGPLAAEVAAALQVDNAFVDLPNNGFLREYWPRSNALLDYETNLHQWILPLIDWLPENVKVNYDGIAGDIVADAVQRASCFYDEQAFWRHKSNDTESLARKVIGPELGFSIFSRRIRRNLAYDDVLAEVMVELRKYSRTENQLTCFYLLNRTRRGVALSPFGHVLQKAESFCPYLDNDLLEFTMKVPLALRIKHTLREETIKVAYPELSKVDRTMYRKRRQAVHGDDEINFFTQKREWLLSNLWLHVIRNNWLFDNGRTLPRAAKALMMFWSGRFHSYLFGSTFLVFFEWLETYRRILSVPTGIRVREASSRDDFAEKERNAR